MSMIQMYISMVCLIIIWIESNLLLTCIDVIKSDQNLITNEKYKDIQQLKEKVSRILSIISRDHMKVVFFGRWIDEIVVFLREFFLSFRTSNGKSTVMNAMLRERILPIGMGHTTNCFLQVKWNFLIDF